MAKKHKSKKNLQIMIGDNGEEVTIPLREYEELIEAKNLLIDMSFKTAKILDYTLIRRQ